MIPANETTFERELRSSLMELTQRGDASSAIDIDGARQRGKRRLRQRRAAVLGGVAAVGTVLFLNVAGPLTTARTVAGAEGAPATDPLVATGKFGWLPSSLSATAYEVGADGSTTRVTGGSVYEVVADGSSRVIGKESSVPAAWLTVYDKGVTPKVGSSQDDGPLHLEPGPKINGNQGYWVVGRSGVKGSGSLTLRWRIEGGRWADVSERALPAKTRQGMVAKLASAARVVNWAVPLPFFVTDLPAGAVVRSGYYSTPGVLKGDGAWDASASYSLKGSKSYVLWRVGPKQGGQGHWAQRAGKETCAIEHDLNLCVSGTGETLSAFGGIEGLLRKLTLLGPDKRNWTTNVVR